ncbi:MAG: hypothetical protein Q8L13_18230 [Bradyrhizobium sp.]|uniref:hypothetical protein n=1 Tax=Bradyrhizobium sp. TaxID=376 RepID=UPI0027321FAB|nr:hypothetical protein [Bradyrhizobium sp.]MDP1868260.1 hypothetical protein [Bradyrhizobium sp.]
MPLLAPGDYRPDVSDYEGQATRNLLNVIPRGDGYGPFPSFSAYSSALPAACRGAFYALKSDGTVVTFAGASSLTDSRLYMLNNTDFTWKPVSRAATVTISSGSPGVFTLAAHGFAANEPFIPYNSGGALPVAFTAGTTYYVKTVLSANTFTASATPGGVAINTASTGTGTHSVTSSYSALTSSAQWQFAQAGNLVFATQANAVLQVFDLSSATTFSDALGAPPQSAYISVVGRFLVLSGLLSTPYRVQWSGLNSFNAPTSWSSGVNSSDFQDFPDGGIVRGVAGGEAGIIFQDQAIRRMSYVPGSPIIFQIDRITQDKGLYAPYSIIRAGERIFFYAGQGFHKIEPGGVPEQIGREKIDRTFLVDLDKGNLQLFMGAADPRSTRVYWAYKSVSGTVGTYDRLLGYDFLLDRFFPVSVSGEYLLGISQTGLTLENLDSIAPSLDELTLSLDAYATAVQPEIAQFSSAHVLGFFRGSNLEATIESAEQGTDENRIMIRGFRPVTDAATLYGSVSYRDTPSASATSGPEVLVNARTGRCDMMRDTRYSRFKVRIPAATPWTFCAGVVPDIATGGTL